MSKILLISMREFKEKLNSKSFLIMTLIGPLLILSFLFLVFWINMESTKPVKVVVSDPGMLLNNYILKKDIPDIQFDIINEQINREDFQSNELYQDYDLLLEVNPKIFQNNTALLFYRKDPGAKREAFIQRALEKRLEEMKFAELTNLPYSKFQELKKPLMLKTANIKTEENAAIKRMSGWVGWFFSVIIFLFIFIFGFQVLRGVSEEKSNRIVEVIVSAVQPVKLMYGKIIGIGLAAFLQFLVWSGMILIGLIVIKSMMFPDLYDPENWKAGDAIATEFESISNQNEFVGLVYNQVNYTVMLSWFFVFFILGYLLYASIFAAVGARISRVSDVQQFLIPLTLPLIFSLFICGYVIQDPQGEMAFWFSQIPLTSPIINMVRLAMGIPVENAWEIYSSVLILIATFIGMTIWAGRIYKNNILIAK
ncbi:MAG: ABC transporter permease [Crocinitomicaceae bacterium]